MAVSLALVVERLLKQLRGGGISELHGVGPRTPVGSDLVMLNQLGGGNQGGVTNAGSPIA